MNKRITIRKNLHTILRSYQHRQYITDNAVLGDGNGNVRVDDKKFECYARVEGVVIRVRNTRTAMIHGLPVIVGYESTQPNRLQVLSVRDRDGVELESNYGIGEHHEAHEYDNQSGGNDVVYVSIRQIMACRVSSALDGLKIYVHRGMALTNSGEWTRVEKADKLDLSSYQPVSGAVYVLIYINLQTGAIEVLEGTTATSLQIIDYTYIPQPEPSTYPLAAVKLYAGQTVISESYGYDGEIVDLRMAAAASGSSNNILLYDSSEEIYLTFPPTGDGLKDATDAASTGDGIFVPPGIFRTNITLPAGVALRGSGPYVTDIAAQVTMTNGSSISAVTITRVATSAGAIYAVRVADGSAAIFESTIRTDNQGTGDGYCIYDEATTGSLSISRVALSALASGGGSAVDLYVTDGHNIDIYDSGLSSIDGDTSGVYRANQYDRSDGSVLSGNIDDYLEIQADGTIILHGEATVFDDQERSLIGECIEDAGGHIAQNNAEASVTFNHDCSTYDYVLTNVQIPHGWKIGSDIHPHLHWWQTSSDIPNWMIQYRWQLQGAAKTTAWTSVKYTTQVFTYSSGTLNQKTEFGDITPPSGASISDIVQFRILRDVSNASMLFAGTDPLSDEVDGISFDPHIEKDALGSNDEYSK